MNTYSIHSHSRNDINKTNFVSSSENQSSLSYPSQTIVKAKLEMTEPDDHDEVEADNAANEIINEGKISRRITGSNTASGVRVSPRMERQLSHLQGGGQSMPVELQTMMEKGFGQDFSQVRLHTDTQAAEMSSSIYAKAFTLNNDIYFNRGMYAPNTMEGQKLVAHELAHVAQRSNNLHREPEEKKSEKELKTVTLHIICSPNAGGEAYFDGNVFSNSIYENGIPDDSVHQIFIKDGETLHEMNEKIKDETKDLNVQNIIISGHGNWFGIKLGNSGEENENKKVCINHPQHLTHLSEDGREFIQTLNEIINKNNPQNSDFQRNIYLDSCSTNSIRFLGFKHNFLGEKINQANPQYAQATYLNFAEALRIATNITSKNGSVNIIANSAPSISGDQKVIFFDNGTIDVEDTNDPNILNNTANEKTIIGNNSRYRASYSWIKLCLGTTRYIAELLYNLLYEPNLDNVSLRKNFHEIFYKTTNPTIDNIEKRLEVAKNDYDKAFKIYEEKQKKKFSMCSEEQLISRIPEKFLEDLADKEREYTSLYNEQSYIMTIKTYIWRSLNYYSLLEKDPFDPYASIVKTIFFMYNTKKLYTDLKEFESKNIPIRDTWVESRKYAKSSEEDFFDVFHDNYPQWFSCMTE